VIFANSAKGRYADGLIVSLAFSRMSLYVLIVNLHPNKHAENQTVGKEQSEIIINIAMIMDVMEECIDIKFAQIDLMVIKVSALYVTIYVMEEWKKIIFFDNNIL
jgi:hypothetical protein